MKVNVAYAKKEIIAILIIRPTNTKQSYLRRDRNHLHFYCKLSQKREMQQLIDDELVGEMEFLNKAQLHFYQST